MWDLTDSAQTIQSILYFVKIALSFTDWGAKVFLVPTPDPHDCSLQLIKRDYGVIVYHNVLYDYRIFTEYANVSI